jgi:hypothetical protein
MAPGLEVNPRSLSYQLFTVFVLTPFELVYETRNLLEEVP